MADLTDVIKAVGAGDRASKFLGFDTIPPAVRQGLNLLTGIANPYAYLASRGYDFLKNQATQQLPQELRDESATTKANMDDLAGMYRNQLRDVLPESIAQSIPEYQPPTYSLEEMGIQLDPMSLMGPDAQPEPQYTPNYTQDIPTLADNVPDMSAPQAQFAYMPETYGDMGYGGGEEFKQGGIASLRRYL